MEQGLLAHFRSTVDKKVNAVVYEAPHCAYYQLNEVQRAWQKTEIQGPLFIVHRTEHPTYFLIILSKHKLGNFAQPITHDVHFEKMSPQLLAVRDQHSATHGVWFPQAEHLLQCYDKAVEIQSIDKQTKSLKDILDLGKEDTVLRSNSPEFIPEVGVPEEMPVLKSEFLLKGVQLQPDTGTTHREGLRQAVISLANSDEFIELLLQALRSRGLSISKNS